MKARFLIFSLILSSFFFGCKETETEVPPVELDSEINQFVWNAMNELYFWQSSVPNLDDDKIDNQNNFHEFLNTYSTPEELFEDLLFEGDRFSWIVEDYVSLLRSFQGISESFGYHYGLIRLSQNSNNIIGYVLYVVPDSPADRAGLRRGDLFFKSNGTNLTVSNYRKLLLNTSIQVLELAELQNEREFVLNGESVTINTEPLEENPILLSKVIDVDGTKVGYLLYNQFISTNQYITELNDTIGSFNNQGVEEMVLDLRYNPGGYVSAAIILASMLYDRATENTLFGSVRYNEKQSSSGGRFSFEEKIPIWNNNGEQIGTQSMNRLSINRLFVLTSEETASASELIIVGLTPYMDVIIVGEKTTGKNVGSNTLYDSPDFLSLDQVNTNHTYAIQPIVFQLANSRGFSNYSGGLNPDVSLDEDSFWRDLTPLGDKNEPLLKAALDMIHTGSARLDSYRAGASRTEKIYSSLEQKKQLNIFRLK